MLHVGLPERRPSRPKSVARTNPITPQQPTNASVASSFPPIPMPGDPSDASAAPKAYPELKESQLQSSTSSTATHSQDEVPEALRKTGHQFKKVPVTPYDSVVSVAVRNGVSEATLRRYNRSLIFDYCDFVDFVWVPLNENNIKSVPPRSNTNRKAMLEKEFVMRTSCTNEEARYYLDDSNYDLAKAMKQFKADNEWEQQKVVEAQQAAAQQQVLRERVARAAAAQVDNTVTASAPPARPQPSAPPAIEMIAH